MVVKWFPASYYGWQALEGGDVGEQSFSLARTYGIAWRDQVAV